jgi:uncharacterized membrane protein YgdD (TMEM256/DUF423 family)
MNRPAFLLLIGALLAATGVMLGAFGAHALRGTLGPAEAGWWQTAVEYQMWHALALVALAGAPLRRVAAPAALIAVGTLLFSGSLYAMALTGVRTLGMVTPVGGILLILGWLLLGWRAARLVSSSGSQES